MKFSSVREALPVTGKRVVDITCDDWDEIVAKFPNPADRISQVYLHFDDGTTLGFWVMEGRGFTYDGWPDEEDEDAKQT